MYSIGLALITLPSVSELSGVAESHAIASSISTHEWVLGIPSERHALTKQPLIIGASILVHHRETMFAELGMDDWRILASVVTSLFGLLLE